MGYSFLFNFTVNLKFPENLNWKFFLLLVLNATQPEQLNTEDLTAFLYGATHLMMGKRASYHQPLGDTDQSHGMEGYE